MERDKVDKAAVGFDYKSQAEKHDSQKGELREPNASGSVWSLGLCPLGLWGTVLGVCNLQHE